MLSLILTLLGFEGLQPNATSIFARSNPRLLEQILVFLVALLDEHSKLKDLLPAAAVTGNGAAPAARRFRLEASRILEELCGKNIIPRNCLIRKSCLESSSGDRLEEALCNLARHCMMITLPKGKFEHKDLLDLSDGISFIRL